MKKRYFVLASIFLFNPVVSIVDVLPDFFAYLFLMIALSKAKYLFDNVGDAYDALKKMLTISFFKTVCMFLLPFVDETMALVFSFTFGLVEIIYAIPAFIKLFDSLSYASLRDVGEDALVKNSDRVKRVTVAFFITKTVLASLPDATALSLNDLGEMTLIEFRPMLFVLSSFFSAIFGIVWLCLWIKYFLGFFKNGSFSDKINEQFCEKILPKKAMLMSKDFITALFIIAAGGFFVLDFSLLNVNVINDGIFSLVASLALLFLLKRKRIKTGPLLYSFFGVSLLHIVFSVLETVFTIKYFDEYDIKSMMTNSDAEDMYLRVEVFAVLSSVALVFAVALILLLVRKYSLVAVKENREFFSEHRIDDFSKEHALQLNKKSIITLVWTLVAAGFYIFYVFSKMYYDFLIVINPIAEIVLAISFATTLNFTSDNVYKTIEKYS